MPLRIVTDSTADFDPDEAERLGIVVAPLTVYFGEEALLDRLEITPDEFYTRLKVSRVLPRTSQPAVARFVDAFHDLAAAGATEILAVLISSKLSGTLNAATTAAARPPAGCRVEAIDSRTVAGGLNAVVREAAEIAARGGSLAEAKQAIELLIPRQHISILLDTLEFLQKGGRIGRARAILGSVLNIKPIVHVHDGEVGAGERVRSRARGLERMFEIATAFENPQRVIVQHTGSANDAEALARRLRGALPATQVEVRWIGPVVGVYTGPNGVGVVTVERLP